MDCGTVTIAERRPDYGPEWSPQSIARLRHMISRRHWTLYRRDRNFRWHRYACLEPSAEITCAAGRDRQRPDRQLYGTTDASVGEVRA